MSWPYIQYLYTHIYIWRRRRTYLWICLCVTYDTVYCTHFFFGCILHTIYHGFRSIPILCPNFIWVATTRSVHQAKLEVNRAPKFNRRLAESRNTDNYFNKVIWRNTRTGSTPDQYTLVAHLLGTLNQLQFAPEMGAPQQLRGLASSWNVLVLRPGLYDVGDCRAPAFSMDTLCVEAESWAGKLGRLNACERYCFMKLNQVMINSHWFTNFPGKECNLLGRTWLTFCKTSLVTWGRSREPTQGRWWRVLATSLSDAR